MDLQEIECGQLMRIILLCLLFLQVVPSPESFVDLPLKSSEEVAKFWPYRY
jgi:hypothetical protein